MSDTNPKILGSGVADPTTMLGVFFAFALVVAAIIIGGNPYGFLDLKSFLIVVCGTLAVTTASFSFHEMGQCSSVIVQTMFSRSEDISQTAIRSLEVAEIARQKGFLEMEKYRNLTDHNEFFQDGIDMIVDNSSAEEVERVVSSEISAMADRRAKSVTILRKSAEVSPAMGLIGTLIGLVQMLGNLEDPASIGPAMAVALLTTFYGAILSYMIFTPIATKLERNTKAELLIANVYLHTLRSIMKKENPRQLELVINSMLPPSKRVRYFDQKRADQQPKYDIDLDRI